MSETLVRPVKGRMPNNTVFIGKKPVMAYVLACMTQFGEGQSEIRIKARGRSISSAVDVAEVVRGRFLQNAKIKNVSIGTEQVENRDKEKSNISTIEILLAK